MGSKTSLIVGAKDFTTPDNQQIDQILEQATRDVVHRVIDHVNTQVKCLESLMPKQNLDGAMQPQVIVPIIIREWVL